jgi:hypothetical protein
MSREASMLARRERVEPTPGLEVATCGWGRGGALLGGAEKVAI